MRWAFVAAAFVAFDRRSMDFGANLRSVPIVCTAFSFAPSSDFVPVFGGEDSRRTATSSALNVSMTCEASHFSDNACAISGGPTKPGVVINSSANACRRA